MRLLVVSQYFWPENFRVNELVEGLVERGHQVTVLTGQPNYPTGRFFNGYNALSFREEVLLGAKILRVPMLARGSGRALQLVLNYLSFALSASLAARIRLSGSFDAIFVFEVSPVTVGLPAIVASRRFSAPILFWVLDLWPESLQATGAVNNPHLLSLIAKGVRWIYAQCAQVLVQSRAFNARIEALGFPSERIRYLPNWTEGDYEQPREGTASVQRNANEFCIVYAGNIGAAQDFPAVVEAATLLAQELPQARWVIAGDGRMSQWLKDEVTRRGLARRFDFLGQLPPLRMPDLFAGADALLVSLRSDPVFALTIPGKVQSYLASGRPVLAMLDGEGARVVVESGAGLAVASGDARSLADSAKALAGMTSTQREEMGYRGREYAQREFGRQAIFDRLEDWLCEATVQAGQGNPK